VFQHYALFKHMSVFENIAFGLRVKPRAIRPSEAQIREKVMRLLSLVQLDWLADRYPSQLSGGQRQRIAIARAFVKDAPILLLDEATSALDNASERAVKDAVALLRQQRSVLVVAHRLSTVRDADRIIVMEHGRAVESGSHDELAVANGSYARLLASGTDALKP